MSTSGARWDGTATTIAVRSPDAVRIELAVLRAGNPEETEWRTNLHAAGEGWWTISSEDLRPGDRYGLRVSGPGFDPAHLLLDPACLAVAGDLDWSGLMAATGSTNLSGGFVPQGFDTSAYVPWSVVVDPAFDWKADRKPEIGASGRVIYEANVKSFTACHPGVPKALRGSYLGMAEGVVIEHLHALGITTLELLPVQQFVTGKDQWRRGLTNLWGYDPVAWFAPHGAYATSDDGRQVAELQTLVRALHVAGIEVVLDVVFNHSGEFDLAGPTISLRGIDDHGWYRHGSDGHYEDFTGCRNTIDLRSEANRQWLMQCLHSWVEVFHVDGFRFDLASTLIRGDDGVDLSSKLLVEIAADPVLSQVLLIAEPWDAAADGYVLGGFPAGWSEWNDRFRDDIRDYWRGAADRPKFATRLAGSSDIFGTDRQPSASINFVTSHDGFTLIDLVSYEQRNNWANGEDNRDGSEHNRSWNCGIEGPTDDPEIVELRQRQQRNLLATLLLARGTPMLLAGDELGRTQLGNNNAYCQDNATSWIDWATADDPLNAFAARVLSLRGQRLEFHDDSWIHADEVTWCDADGAELTDTTWPSDEHLMLVAYPDLMLIANPNSVDRAVSLPENTGWLVALDTRSPNGSPAEPETLIRSEVWCPSRTLLVLLRGSD